ncbi:PI-PLC X domain-containing protein 1 isoform X2 [Rhineura floridana]|uniref:PI-PLC X domain-containing protein 1 isoform X2 n=1 Tax=Rhineura floridana TaxID=261503 RepID=UPI002AC8847E|nr:PI-PLC X domain-containing protein 1 isoform X2 [Rhineura floridana]
MKECPKKKSINFCSEGPQWMSHLPECLWGIPLSNLSLPGSHDAMTYCLDKESEVLTVLEQLDAGIRYFDLRIAHKPNDSSMNLHFIHMVYTTVVVEAVLWDILRWLKNHPWEVVILAFRNFDGLDDDHHCHLVSCIKKIFSDRLCPRNVIPTLKSMWSSGYQVIVSYDKPAQVLKHCELWPAIPYWWGNKTTAQGLIQYLEQRKQNGRPVGLFVAGINLTGDLGYILAHLRGSVKKMTLPALPFLNLWITKQRPGSKKDCINIIAGDFIEKNNFVKNVINLNRKLLK